MKLKQLFNQTLIQCLRSYVGYMPRSRASNGKAALTEVYYSACRAIIWCTEPSLPRGAVVASRKHAGRASVGAGARRWPANAKPGTWAERGFDLLQVRAAGLAILQSHGLPGTRLSARPGRRDPQQAERASDRRRLEYGDLAIGIARDLPERGFHAGSYSITTLQKQIMRRRVWRSLSRPGRAAYRPSPTTEPRPLVFRQIPLSVAGAYRNGVACRFAVSLILVRLANWQKNLPRRAIGLLYQTVFRDVQSVDEYRLIGDVRCFKRQLQASLAID